MKRYTLLTVLLMLVCSVLLVACDSGGEEVNLPERITINTTFGQSATVHLPHGWPARGSEEENQIVLCNHETCGADFVGGNQILGNMFIFGESVLPSIFTPEMSPRDVVLATAQQLAGSYASQGVTVTMNEGDIDTFSGNDKSGATLTINVITEVETLSFQIVVVEEEAVNGFTILQMNGAEGELEQFDNFIRAIATSVEFSGGS